MLEFVEPELVVAVTALIVSLVALTYALITYHRQKRGNR